MRWRAVLLAGSLAMLATGCDGGGPSYPDETECIERCERHGMTADMSPEDVERCRRGCRASRPED